jgi:hypothetical protein
MPKLSIFKRYFDLLKLISFASSYYTTLKQMCKIPVFEYLQKANLQKTEYNVPKLFPPIPVRYYSFHKLMIKLGDIVKLVNERLPNTLDKKLAAYVNTGSFSMDLEIEAYVKQSLTSTIRAQVQKPG